VTIHLYTFGWNEMRMIGFFIRHYEPWVDKFIFFDDGSTDGMLDLLASKTNVEVRPFAYAFPDSFSLSVQAWRNACWKESRGEADWVIVTDVDEHLHHPEMMSYLAACKSEGVTYIPALGFDMVTESFPHEDEHLASTRTIGAPSAVYSKLRIFDPNAIEEVNYEIGAHSASPRGRLVLPTEDALLLLHYKHLGTSHVPSRHAALAARLRERDLKNKWGAHYLFDDRRYGQYLADLTGRLLDVTDANYLPSRDHRERRWWRPELSAAASPAEAREGTRRNSPVAR
jgi:glycosyltransferase involved in cell wall biosynthesis